jgi:SAM-dependent methyltransferase
MQLQNLSVLWPNSIRGRAVADIGCAAGSFLDHIHGLTETAVAIEPFTGYHDSLRARGYDVFQYTNDAAKAWTGRVDNAFSFSVLEHVDNPRRFLSDIAALLTDDGELMLSTPNRTDALMELLPDAYPAFFYRSVHRWYFDAASLSALAEHAGLIVREIRCVHRYSLSNALRWIRDRKPGGREDLPHIDARLDAVWQRHLEAEGAGDYLYARLTRR